MVVDADGLTYPVGYCVGPIDLDDPDLINSLGGSDSIAYGIYRSKVTPFLDEYHLNGHDTKEEACACYKRYLLDNRLVIDSKLTGKDSCVVCGARTEYAALLEGMHYVLCNVHRNRDEVSNLMPVLLEIFV
jgi:hypothetical protein